MSLRKKMVVIIHRAWEGISKDMLDVLVLTMLHQMMVVFLVRRGSTR
jgi:hypothetical protein